MNSRKKWICSLLTTAFVCSCSSFGSVGGIKGIKKGTTLYQIKSLYKKSISDLLEINNPKGMGYKITDDMSLEVQTLLKFLSIISTQFSKCARTGLNKFSTSFRNKRSKFNSIHRSSKLIELVSDFCKSDENIKNLDIWYNALCRSACSETEIPTYLNSIPSDQDKGMFEILFAYRNWKPECGEWNDYLKKVEEFPDCKLSSQKLKSARQVEAKINGVAKSILEILDPKNKRDSLVNVWSPLRVFKIK